MKYLCVPVFVLLFTSTLVAQQAPKALLQGHAHNDYRHERPFWDAYDHGFCSIEVDIFAVGDQLVVAHDVADLVTAEATFEDLYLKPLQTVVRQNGGRVYKHGPPTITLLVDIKQDGERVFRLLKQELSAYREILCCREGGVWRQRAVQVVVSGDRPKTLIQSDPDRLMAIDGRISDLPSDLSPTLLPLISDRWTSHFKWMGEGPMPRSEQKKLAKLVSSAHEAGRKIRFWATPENPTLWKQLLDAGVDMINTDQLSDLKEFLESDESREPAPQQDLETVFRIGMIGCHRQDKPAPAFNRYLQASPDIMVWMGDNVYADTADDISYIEECYQRMASQTAFQKLRESVPFVVTWDDHDYGMNNDGKNYKLKDQSRQLFRKFWSLEKHIPANRDGIYHSRFFGDGEQRLQLIMLDTRYNRDDEGDQSDTLGEKQWRWLEQELQKPAKLRMIASGYQVLLDREQKFETWSKFPSAKSRLFDLIKSTKTNGVIFLAGDQHYGEVSRVKNAIGYDAIELMFSGINQEEPHVFNSHRVSPVAHALNSYALIDIQWEQNEIDVPHVVFRCFDADTNIPELTYRVNFSELESPSK